MQMQTDRQTDRHRHRHRHRFGIIRGCRFILKVHHKNYYFGCGFLGLWEAAEAHSWGVLGSAVSLR